MNLSIKNKVGNEKVFKELNANSFWDTGVGKLASGFDDLTQDPEACLRFILL